MEINILFLSCACSLFVCGVFCFSRPTAVTFVDNSFRGVLVAIQSDVQRDLRLIDYIKVISQRSNCENSSLEFFMYVSISLLE